MDTFFKQGYQSLGPQRSCISNGRTGREEAFAVVKAVLLYGYENLFLKQGFMGLQHCISLATRTLCSLVRFCSLPFSCIAFIVGHDSSRGPHFR